APQRLGGELLVEEAAVVLADHVEVVEARLEVAGVEGGVGVRAGGGDAAIPTAVGAARRVGGPPTTGGGLAAHRDREAVIRAGLEGELADVADGLLVTEAALGGVVEGGAAPGGV